MAAETVSQKSSIGVDFSVDLLIRPGATCKPDPRKGCDFRNFALRLVGQSSYSQCYQEMISSKRGFIGNRPSTSQRPENYGGQSIVASCDKCYAFNSATNETIPGAILIIDKVVPAQKKQPEPETRQHDRRDLYLPNSRRKFR